MKKSKYTDEQIAFALKQAETGTPVAEVIRRMGISEQTFYRWKKVYGGLGVGELRRLKLLEEENRKLKQLVADLRQADRQCVRGIVQRPPARRVPEHALVPVAGRRPSQDRGLAAGL